MKFSSGALAAMVMAATSIGCATTPKGDSGEVEVFTYDAELGEQTMRVAELALPWEINNPGPAAVTVDAVTWTLTVDGQEIDQQTVELERGVATATTATGTLRTRVEFSTTDEAFSARQSDPVLRWQVSAVFEVGGGPDGLTEFEAQWDGEFSAPRRPEVTASGQAAKSNQSSVEVSFTVTIANTNPFPIEIEGLDFELFIKDQLVESGRLATGQRLDGASELRFDLGKVLDKKDEPKLVRELLKTDTIPYRIEGELAAAGIRMAVPVKGEITFSK